MEAKQWAVCPRIDDRERPDKPQAPKLFDSEDAARRFLNSLARWPRDRLRQREEALRRYKAGEIAKHNFPQNLVRRKNKEEGWEGPFPVVQLETARTAQPRTFENFLPLSEVGDVPERALDDIILRVFEGRGAHYRYVLSDAWNFPTIEDDLWNRAGHLFEGRRYASISHMIVKAVYDANAGLEHLYPGISASSISSFFVSWQFWRHMASLCQRVGQSTTARVLAGDWLKARSLATASYDWVCEQMAAYAYELGPWAVADEDAGSTRKRAAQTGGANSRVSLLKAYKLATGEPSNKQIYTARNSHIHKPEFYKWLNGKLRESSATCQNFERFLREKEPPVPRRT